MTTSSMAMENASIAGYKLSSRRPSTIRSQRLDRPNYWAGGPDVLDTTANVRFVGLGSGSHIYSSILPALEQAQDHVILVTCFWARSETLNQINESLRRLSKRGQERGRIIRVRICFSSLSVWQKLFHTRSLEGRDHPASSWQKTLGLPSPHELQGIDLKIKSIFIQPFSVMHPKFIIIDHQRVFLPSCNVSWENWFEGCIELTGPITDHFVRFWHAFWEAGRERNRKLATTTTDTQDPPNAHSKPTTATSRAFFLPSPHHAWSLLDGTTPTSPPTPLNLFTLAILGNASRSVYIQTPNLTSGAVLQAILASLSLGIDFRIVTSEKLMIMEQLVTARTTTARCVKWLGKKHQKLLAERTKKARTDSEAQYTLGKLEMFYYEPRPQTSDPVQSHIKLTIVDEKIIVLGSGNLDRASWVTSQELGVAVVNSNFVKEFKGHLDEALDGRLRQVYP